LFVGGMIEIDLYVEGSWSYFGIMNLHSCTSGKLFCLVCLL
jgi:hypothetical protein